MDIYASKTERVFRKAVQIGRYFGISGLILLATAVVLFVIAVYMLINAYRWHEIGPAISGSILMGVVVSIVYLVFAFKNTPRA